MQLERVRKDIISSRRKELTSFELRQRDKAGYSANYIVVVTQSEAWMVT